MKKLNAFSLKIIAIVAMLINHIGNSNLNIASTNYGFYIFSLVIGKITFPIMAYLLVEGYYKTSSHKKYALRLAICWILSIVPFWLIFSYPSPFTFGEVFNNVIFTLLMGLILIILCEKTDSSFKKSLLAVVFALITINSDWGFFGIIMIYGFYRIRNPKAKVAVPTIAVIGLFMIMGIAAISTATLTGLRMNEIIVNVLVFLGLLLAIPLLLMYNGERGNSQWWAKWSFFIFYPLHMLIIGLIAM